MFGYPLEAHELLLPFHPPPTPGGFHTLGMRYYSASLICDFNLFHRLNLNSAKRVLLDFNALLYTSGRLLTPMLGVCVFCIAAPRTFSQV